MTNPHLCGTDRSLLTRFYALTTRREMMVPLFIRTRYSIVLATTMIAYSLVGLATASETKDWEHSVNLQTKERFIPVELWAGAEWDGKKELKMPKIDATYRHRSTYQIKGPVEWEHPTMRMKFLVYERINAGRDGVKLQLFTINQEQNGLGRVYDGRPGRDGRLSSGGLKFPLGLWKEGETRKFVYQIWQARGAERVESITIQKIDFVSSSSPHCLEFYWTLASRSGGTIYDRQTYIYCPGKSMVSQIQH